MIGSFTRKLGGWGMLHGMRAYLLLLPLLGLPSPMAAAPTLAPAPATLPDRDHERVRAAVARGEMVPLDEVLADAQRRHPGKVLEVELENDEYEVEILGDDGVIRELEYDVRTGALLEIEVEND